MLDYNIFSNTSDDWAGDSGVGLETVNSKLPVDTTVTYNGLPSLLLNSKTPTSPSWFNALVTVAGWKAYDFTSYYANGFLESNVKGNAGGESFLIGFKDRVFERAAGNEISTTVNTNSYVNITTNWTHVKKPLKDVMPISQGIYPSSIDALTIKNNGFQPLKVWINDIKVMSPDKEKEYAPIKVNQVGYPVGGVKQALVTGFEDVLTVDAWTPFSVINATTNSTAYSGTLVLTDNYDAEMMPEKFTDSQFNIPESGNCIPDILDESRWELEWLLKMQDAASGGFYARVTFQDDDNLVDREIIDKDTVSSRTNIKTTSDTATAAGVLAHAYLIFQTIDPVFAQ